MSDDDSSQYPDPLVIEPKSGNHKQSWIILHGRGDRAKTFATGWSGFLNLPFPDGSMIQDHLPDVKFVFPTASYRRAQAFSRATITQWFDIYSWGSLEHTDWQVEGLRETSAWVHRLLEKEIEAVGAANVVLGGLSQGCASVLISALLWSGEPIKAIFGMSGWLPFKHVIELSFQEPPKNDVFEREGTETSGGPQEAGQVGKRDAYARAIGALCLELEVFQPEGTAAQRIPIMIAHGGSDEKVNTQLGRDIAPCLQRLGCNVSYKEYPTLEHWMRGDELQDIVQFVAQS